MQSDTEESIAGTAWHQEASGSLATMLRIVADRRGASWGVCEQIQVLGLRKESGEEYSPRPDVMVLPHPIDKSHSSIHVSELGTPLFIAEIASESTLAQDLADKAYVYGQLGVPEYLVFEPGGTWLKGQLRAWRLQSTTASAYTLWLPDEQGRLFSTALAVTIHVTQPLLGVCDRDGRLIESAVTMARRIEELERRLHAIEQQERDQDRTSSRLGATFGPATTRTLRRSCHHRHARCLDASIVAMAARRYARLL
ncbi:MAG: Uma2 family endonuclease [Chloroflexi bacterium]|nr:Uma2 family endonuclease [Chloroflexota bacterium]